MTTYLLLRRIHMYLALFLVPWVLMYALSILCMNHMEFLRGLYRDEPGRMYIEKQITYDRPLPPAVDPKAAAGSAPRIDGKAAGRQILQDLGMDGAHWADARRDGSQVSIGRNNVIAPRQITYTPTDGKLVVKRQTFQLPEFLRRLHKRRGYDQPYLADTAWAVSVDLVIVSMLLWAATGLWMWYRTKPTRRWGMLCLAIGCILFTVFLVAI